MSRRLAYPVMLYLGLVAGIAAGNVAAKVLALDPWRVFTISMLLIPAGLIGARLLYVALHWDSHYRHRPERIWDRSDGGMAMYGGLPVTLLLSVPLARAFGLGLGAFWDAAIFTILAGIAFTKVGCYLNGCCAGRLPVPVQLLEAAWAASAGVAGALWLLPGPYPGAVFLRLAAVYAAGRLVLERFRTSGGPAVGPLFSVAMLVLFVLFEIRNVCCN